MQINTKMKKTMNNIDIWEAYFTAFCYFSAKKKSVKQSINPLLIRIEAEKCAFNLMYN